MRFFADVGKCSVAVVVVKNGDAGSRCFDDVFFCVFPAENYRSSEPGFLRNIGEVHNWLGVCTLGLLAAKAWRVWRLHGEPSTKHKEREEPVKRRIGNHQSPMIARSGSAQENRAEIPINGVWKGARM